MNVEPGRSTLPSVTRTTANDLLHEIVAGLFDVFAQTKARIAAFTSGNAFPARSGLPPRETTAPIRSGSLAAATSAAAAPCWPQNSRWTNPRTLACDLAQ